jgi:hypothetical protein
MKITTKTKYFAIKKSIDYAVIFFIENKDKFTVEINMHWNDEVNEVSGNRKLIVFRDDLNKQVNTDNIPLEFYNKNKLKKKKYLEIWEAIK